jgi:predicted AlkP superfamily phosphohydrolase/phosphomutase
VKNQILIVGWDGADWEIIDDLIARGELPHVADMVRSGAWGTLHSTIPINSWAAWPTFLTGTGPGGHGVFDLIERHPTRRGMRAPVFSTSIRVRTFLERLSEAGYEVRAANIPVTFPPFPINGRMISGGGILPNTAFTYPPDWGDGGGAQAGFPVNGMEWARFEEDAEGLIQEADLLIRKRTEWFEALLEGDWSVAVCVYVATDRLQHPLGDHVLPSHPRYPERADSRTGEKLRCTYRSLDEALGRLQAAAGREVTTLLISDHGFEPVDRAYNVNAILRRQGFAIQGRATGAPGSLRRSRVWQTVSATPIGRLIRHTVRRPPPLNWSRTAAYQSASGEGVSVNLKGREPNGIVERKDLERVREEIREALLGFEDEDLGMPIREVLRSEEFYAGPSAHLAPDLLALPNPLWVPDYTDQAATRLSWPTADHRRSGILVASGASIAAGKLTDRELSDIAPTILAAFDVPFSGLEGRVIEEIAGVSDASLETGELVDVGPPLVDTISDEDIESVAAHPPLARIRRVTEEPLPRR